MVGKQRISQEQKDKIYEGHRLGYSTYKTAEYASVSVASVSREWNKEGLKPHFKDNKPLTQEQKDKILEGHRLGYTISKTAEYAGVSTTPVLSQWNKEGLKPHFKPRVLIKKAKETLETIADWPDEEKIIILGALPSHKKYSGDDLRRAIKRDERYPKATLGPLKVNYDTNRQYDVQQQVESVITMNPKVIDDKKALDLLVNKIFSVHQGKVSNNPDTIDEVIEGMRERLENVR